MAAVASSCIESAPISASPTAAASPNAVPILPWQVGNSWTYRVTDHAVVSQKITTIEPAEPIGGSGPHAAERAFKIVTLKADGTDQTISWQAPLGDAIVRYREQSFASGAGGALELDEYWDPYKLHVDGGVEHTQPDADWFETYLEAKLPVGGSVSAKQTQDHWSVDQVDATVSVPAGTFQHAIIFLKGGGADLKTYWYVRGVGKIKETGGQTEELVSYRVAP